MRCIIAPVAILFLFASCKGKEEKLFPQAEKITESVYASGLVKSKNQYEVYSTVSGLVAEILVTENDTVSSGDPLIRLTNTREQLNTENAQLSADYYAAVTNSEKLSELQISIKLALAKMENDALLLQRQKNLWAQQIGSLNELEQRELAYKNSTSGYQSAKLRYAEMSKQILFQQNQSQKNLQLSKTTANDYIITSKTSGRVYRIFPEKGELVSMQNPVVLIGDAYEFQLELQVDEYDISKIKQGQRILLSMDSYKDRVFEAAIDKVLPLMNERTQSFTIYAKFKNQPAVLFPNLTCEANIIIQEKENIITIPRNYLMEGDFVLLATKEKRKVVTGLKDYQKVEIISGLTVKDAIIKPVL